VRDQARLKRRTCARAARFASAAHSPVAARPRQSEHARRDPTFAQPRAPVALLRSRRPLAELPVRAAPSPLRAQAQEEYGQLLEQFIKYSAEQPGTHVSEVAKTMQVVLAAGRPYSSYKVGADSKAAPIVGSLPVTVSEWIIKKSMCVCGAAPTPLCSTVRAGPITSRFLTRLRVFPP
jgi:hypothetical protein